MYLIDLKTLLILSLIKSNLCRPILNKINSETKINKTMNNSNETKFVPLNPIGAKYLQGFKIYELGSRVVGK